MRVVVGEVDTVPPHRHARPEGFPYWIIGITLVGGGRIWNGAGSITTEPGTIGVTEPGTEYRLLMSGGPRYREYFAILAIPDDWTMWRTWPEVLPGMRRLFIRHSPIWPEVISAFETAHRHFKSGSTAEDLAINSLERALLLANSQNPAREAKSVDDRINQAINHARERLSQPLCVDDLAKAAHVSTSRLAHLFKEKTGESPMRHVEGLRIRRAQELLLSTGLPIREVARMVGYGNPYHFSDRFRNRTGQSPRGFRTKPPGSQ